jgi:hypothetical protein
VHFLLSRPGPGHTDCCFDQVQGHRLYLPSLTLNLVPPPLLFLAALLSTLIAGAWPRVLLPSSRGVTLHELPFSTFVCANDATSWTHASYNQREEEVAVGHPISLLRISL